MSRLFECVACSHQRRARLRPLCCEGCGRTETYCLSEYDDKSSKAVCALNIVSAEPERYPTGDCEFDSLLGGGLVRPSALTAFGRGGTGKSRSCFRWSTHIGKTLLVSLEMPRDLAVYSAKSARADLAKLFVTESEDTWQAQAQEINASCIVLDSFHYSRKQKLKKGTKIPEICFDLSEWAKATNGIVFVICHSNKKNEVSGTTAIEHWPDYLLKFAKHGDGESKLTLPKARYCPTGSCIITI